MLAVVINSKSYEEIIYDSLGKGYITQICNNKISYVAKIVSLTSAIAYL